MKLLGIVLAGLVASYNNMRLSLYRKNQKQRAIEDRKPGRMIPAVDRPHWQPDWQEKMRMPNDDDAKMEALLELLQQDLLD